ncbi:Zn-dependent hydrolase [Methylobacterium nodulans]|uniref:Amidase, hydantoinase/carbamoylase family n=1 Tax=Methylobacterium nodulans (strain LMG 21967 / CNCM I-2342 / ORS 2060) TaxID=460265 RepID=B8IXL4_METNO|nr:Zn-dependent hydrolase [Methylobacterium nodulans]ACL62846.1 amidase, hydantoinase/carbamoylase family [Methylobacterium nodulans ORS 2060]
MSRSSNIRPNISRLWSSLMRSAEIGATPRGGLRRLALTEEDGEVRREFIRWCEEAGCVVRVDGIGNIFAFRAGQDPDAKAVLVGSHLDTQIKGGRFDGILGVLAGLELVRTLNDHGVTTRRPIAVVNWTNEEGARFEPPMIGSAVFTGRASLDFAHGRADKDGITLGQALDAIGFRGTDRLSPEAFDSLFELHIEQGPHLDEAKRQVGVVTGAFSVRGMVVEVVGETGHVGPTPMPKRRNAIVGAARVTLAVDDIGWSRHETGGKSTTMRLRVEPNLLGILPDRVEMTCDFRHPDDAVATEMLASLKAQIPDIEQRSGCKVSIREQWSYGGMQYDPGCVGLVREVAQALGYSTMDLLTEAGHDAMHAADHLPTAMIFTPCEGGLSHNEAENVTPDDIEPGVNVLLQSVLRRAEVV